MSAGLFSERRGKIYQREDSISYISSFSVVYVSPHVFSFLSFKFRKEKNEVFLTTFSSSLFIFCCGIVAVWLPIEAFGYLEEHVF